MDANAPLVPCPACRRHLFARSARCPFCGVHLALGRLGCTVALGATIALTIGCQRTPEAGSVPAPEASIAAASAPASSAPATAASSSDPRFAGLNLSGAYGPPPPDGGSVGLADLGASGAYGAPPPSTEGAEPKVSADVGAVAGDTDRVANAERVLAGGRAGFRRCYFLGLQESSKQQGQVTFHLSVDAKGAVSNVTARATGTLSDRVVSCMTTRIKFMQFAPPTGSTPARLSVTVTLAHQTD